MDSMVLEMLDFSRLEAGKVTLATDQFSLLALTKRVFDRLNLQLQEKNLAVHFDIAEDFLTTADEARIEQVVTNFATNAIKFSPEGGEIHLNIFQHTGKTMFTIANQCENLPEETLERIWDSFYRADSSRTVKGTGLGLPIARAVIHLHRGTCEARNTSTGVEFRFMLPQ
jgi:signal transduction histidine kinase